MRRRWSADSPPIFGEPEALLSNAPVVLGIDGAKMSKTRGNTITLGADEDHQTTAAIRAARAEAACGASPLTPDRTGR